MSDKCFIDTNILIYAFSEDHAKAKRAEAILAAGGSISVQVLNEFASVCSRKLKLDWKEIEERLAVVKTLISEVAPLNLEAHEKAVELARNHKLSFWDALVVATAFQLGCIRLLTEDMQDGWTLGVLTIENPFLSGP
jgi:predicted nucleic acid-binding protein